MPRLEQRHTDLAHGLFTVLDCEADVCRVGVAGGERPAEVGVEDAQRLKCRRRLPPWAYDWLCV
jgi:hypothetical protein